MSGIRLRIGCERKAVVLFGLASEPVLQFLHGRKICAKKTQSIEIIAEYYIIQLSRLRLLDCLSCFVEQLQGEQAVDKDCVWEAIVGGKVEALAIRGLQSQLILAAKVRNRSGEVCLAACTLAKIAGH